MDCAAPTDEALLLRGRDGDEDAFRVLFDRHAELLRAHFDRGLPPYVRRKVSVADLVQETRLVVVERCREFEDRGGGSFLNWLMGIARMKLREFLRRHVGTAKRATGREVSRGRRPDTEQALARGPSPSEHAIASETAERARAAFAKLPEDYREILRLVREEGGSLGEAGERMGRSREAAKKLYARAILRFTRLLEGGVDG